MKRLIFIIFFILVVFYFCVSEITGMPAFARQHKLSCKTCHDPFPRLKPFGDDFAANGFKIDDNLPSRYSTDTGDDKLTLLRSFPFAVRMDLYASGNKSNEGVFDFSTPLNVKLLSGGPISKNISYYFYFFFSEGGEIVGLEDAFLIFRDVFGTGIDVTLGQFQISDPIFKRELRLTYEDYKIFKLMPGQSHLDLTYDRGLMLSYSIPKGGPDFVLEILNGTGLTATDDFKNFDSDSLKNIFVRGSQDIGDHFRLGGFYFFGKETAEDITNKVKMFGGDFSVSFYPLEINFQYMERTDDNAYMIGSSQGNLKSNGGLLEMIYTFGGVDSPWYGVGLYNWVKSDDDFQDYESVALHLGYLLRRNIKLLGEVGFVIKSPFGEYTRFLAGVITAF